MRRCHHINGLVQEKRNSITNALELRLSRTNPSIYNIVQVYTSNGLRHLYWDWTQTCKLCKRWKWIYYEINQCRVIFSVNVVFYCIYNQGFHSSESADCCKNGEVDFHPVIGFITMITFWIMAANLISMPVIGGLVICSNDGKVDCHSQWCLFTSTLATR